MTPRDVQTARLSEKLRRELGPVVLKALSDPDVIAVKIAEDLASGARPVRPNCLRPGLEEGCVMDRVMGIDLSGSRNPRQCLTFNRQSCLSESGVSPRSANRGSALRVSFYEAGQRRLLEQWV